MELSEDFLIWLILGITLHDLWPWINVNLLKSSRAFSCSDSFCQGKVMKTDYYLCINTTESRKSDNGYYRSYGVQNTIRFGPYEEQKGTFRIRLDNSGSKNTWNSWGMEGGGETKLYFHWNRAYPLNFYIPERSRIFLFTLQQYSVGEDLGYTEHVMFVLQKQVNY